MKQALTLKLGQGLTMTPALQQAIKMLQMSSLDLSQTIQEVLDSNLMLEAFEAPPTIDSNTESHDDAEPASPDAAETIPDELPVDAQWDDIYDGQTHRSTGDQTSLYEYQQANLNESETLQEHVLWQLNVSDFAPLKRELAMHMVDAINDNGYLADWASLSARLIDEYDVQQEDCDEVLQRVQAFDPPGVAARDLPECLCIQLEQLPAETPGRKVANELVIHYLERLAKHDYAGMCEELNVDEATLKTGLALIQSLEPHPGVPFAKHESNYINPEVVVEKVQGVWQVNLNPEIAPRIRINPEYLGLVRRADQSKDQKILKDHLQEARYFLNSLKSRNETLLRVAQVIIQEQRAFLDYGEEAMKPLVLRDVAEQIGVHESTVSRATSVKYMLTPRGVFELKYFFSSHVSTTEGGVCSATAIQAMIKRLINNEPPEKPLSDSKLANLLLEEGVKAARRTVAKYREGLNIPPSHERKRLV